MTKDEKSKVRFAICLAGDHPRLESRRVYRVLPDPVAEAIHWIRVVDESGEDYIYPEKNFVFVELPKKARQSIPNVVRSATPQRTVRTARKAASLKRAG